MSQHNSYEMKIIGMVIYQHLEKKLPIVTAEELKKLESQLDNIVWEVATKIYQRSGHKVEFIFAKEFVELWLSSKKEQLDKADAINAAKKQTDPSQSKTTTTRPNWTVISSGCDD